MAATPEIESDRAADEARIEKRRPAALTQDVDDGVTRHIQTVVERSEAALTEWCDDVRSSADELAGVLANLADNHEEMIGELEWSADDAAIEYRRYLRGVVLEQLEDRLGNIDVAHRLGQAHRRMVERLGDGMRGIPDTASKPEESSLYLPQPGDGAVCRVRKARVRWGRGVRRVARNARAIPRSLKGGQTPDPPPPRQDVPVARLASYHLQVRLPEHFAVVEESLHQILGRLVADVARAVTEHGHEVLLAERGRDVRLAERRQEVLLAEHGQSPSVDEESAGEAATLQAAATAFNKALRSAADRADVSDVLDDARNRASEAADALDRDVHLAGTFMLDLDERKVTGVRPDRERREEIWRTWHDRVHGRIELMAHVLDLREDTLKGALQLVGNVSEVAIAPAIEALAAGERSLRQLADKARDEFQDDERGDHAASVRQYLDDALAAVDREAVSPFREEGFAKKTRVVAETRIGELAALFDALPERVEINELTPPEARALDPTTDPLVVELREYASRAYDALVMRRLQSAAAVVADGLKETNTTIAGIPDILRFNLEAALEEVDAPADEPDASGARELAVGGLERSADVLREAARALSELRAPFVEQVDDVIEYGFNRLHERLRVEVRMRGQILDLQSGAAEQLRELTSQTSETVRRGSIVLRRTYRTGLQRARTLLELGQAAVGLAESTEEERLKTVEALADLQRLTEQLPLVYRRLFTFQPVTDASMLSGRGRDLAYVRRHAELWARGLTNALVLTGYPGSGLTSVLNIVRSTILEESNVAVLDLRTRISSEDELTQRLAAALEIDLPEGATLETLEEGLEKALAGSNSSRTQACFVEHLEHLYLRRIGGTEIVERFLGFVSRTDGLVFWLLTVGDTAWQVISRVEPAAAGLVTIRKLSPISLEELRSIVLDRHKRSGLPLHFETPSSEANPIVARRVRKARTEQARQEILRAEFFERLHRDAGQNIMLGLLYWLRSVEMDADEGLLRVRMLEPLNFSALDALDLDRAFTLRSLLEHASLTIEEHSELARIPAAESLQLFQNLSNLLLIEPFDNDKPEQVASVSIEYGVPYRIRSLLIHPVTKFLQRRNILH